MKKAVIGIAATAAVVQIGICGFFYHTAVMRKKKIKEPDPEKMSQIWRDTRALAKERTEWLNRQKSEKLFITAFDGIKLRATLIPAEKESRKTILAVHGYTSTGIKEYCLIAPFFHALGYNILLVDDRAHGESEGKYVGYGWNDHKDCMKWIDYLTGRYGESSSIILFGVSMGAATVMITAGENLPSQVKGVIEDCGYTTAWREFTHVLKQDYHLPAYPTLPLANIWNKLVAGYDFKACSALDAVRKTKLPILFIHGDLDNFVPTDMGKELYEACGSDKRLLIIEGAGHAQNYNTKPEIYENAVREFLEEFV